MKLLQTLKAIRTDDSVIHSYQGSEITQNVSFMDSFDTNYEEEQITYNSPSLLDKELMVIAPADVRIDGAQSEYITKDTLASHHIVPDTILNNVYADSVRGDVILAKLADCSYRVPTYREELTVSSINDLTNHEPQFSFTYSEGVQNMISNPFKGLDLTNGITISFWMRVPSFHALASKSAALTFLGDQVHLEHPSKPDGINNDVVTTPFLTIETNGNIYFGEAYMNIYAATLTGADTTYATDIPPYRKSLGRRWEHIILSITDDAINLYINGVKVEHDMVYKGKRFNNGNGTEGNTGMSTLSHFISNEDTNIYLGLTIVSETGQCEQIMYDDISFYDEAVDDTGALNLYEEAKASPLPNISTSTDTETV